MQYQIVGAPFSAVVCSLSDGESIKCQSGAMSWMSSNIQMKTSTGGGLGKIFAKALTHESLFINTYTAQGGAGEIAFASTMPGNILPIDVSKTPIVAQKSSFLASETNVDMEIFFQKKIGAGFFGGEGFIMQKFKGSGMAFLELDGSIVEKDLAAGETLVVDTSYLAAMEATCTMDIQMVPGVGNAILGGEGLFNTKVTGPGHIWLQTMPAPNFAGSLAKYLPSN